MATDSLQTNPSNPISKPATRPEMAQIAVSHFLVTSFSASMPSISMLLPRDTMMATKPQPIAAPKDSPTSTRQATLPHGRMTVQSQL